MTPRGCASVVDQKGDAGQARRKPPRQFSVEPAALGPEHDDPHRRVLAQAPHDPGEVEPPRHGERIDRRVVHENLGDALAVDGL